MTRALEKGVVPPARATILDKLTFLNAAHGRCAIKERPDRRG
jgi:hypothetical protein